MAYQERGAGDEEAKERPSGAAIEAGPAADGAAATASHTKPAATSSAASPTTSWRHVGLLWAACGLTVGAYYSKDVLAAVSPDVSWWLLVCLYQTCIVLSRGMTATHR